MSKLWESTFSALYDPLLWVGERAGMAQRRSALLGRQPGGSSSSAPGRGSTFPITRRTSTSWS